MSARISAITHRAMAEALMKSEEELKRLDEELARSKSQLSSQQSRVASMEERKVELSGLIDELKTEIARTRR